MKTVVIFNKGNTLNVNEVLKLLIHISHEEDNFVSEELGRMSEWIQIIFIFASNFHRVTERAESLIKSTKIRFLINGE